MPTDQPSTPIDKPPRRKWHRLHLSTCVVILLLMGFFVIVEIPGEASYPIIATGFSISGGGGVVFGETFSHGWPWEYLSRDEGACSGNMIEVPWLAPRAWNVFSRPKLCNFSFLYAILDFIICLTIIAAIAVGFEWRRRQRTRLFQFTLRELLLLMLLTAGVFSWWRMHHNQRVHEQNIVDRFQKDLSSEISWSVEYRGPRILAKLFGEDSLSDFWSFTEYQCSYYENRQDYAESFSSLKDFPGLEKIECSCDGDEKSFVTDELLSQLASLKNLRCLNLPHAKITDSGMETISRFAKLETLSLYGTPITSRGVQCLKSTPLLETLQLAETKIDDAVAETIGGLENLWDLDVSDTKLTDKSVSHLGRLSRLYFLDISGTQISEEGYRRLKAMLPECGIEWK